MTRSCKCCLQTGTFEVRCFCAAGPASVTISILLLPHWAALSLSLSLDNLNLSGNTIEANTAWIPRAFNAVLTQSSQTLTQPLVSRTRHAGMYHACSNQTYQSRLNTSDP